MCIEVYSRTVSFTNGPFNNTLKNAIFEIIFTNIIVVKLLKFYLLIGFNEYYYFQAGKKACVRRESLNPNAIP